MESGVKEAKYWSICLAICLCVIVAGIAIGCTVASVRASHRDEVIKVAAAESGCNYVHGEMLCVGAAEE